MSTEADAVVLHAGNIHANHQAGLLFIDFETGATLQISGARPVSALASARTCSHMICVSHESPAIQNYICEGCAGVCTHAQ